MRRLYSELSGVNGGQVERGGERKRVAVEKGAVGGGSRRRSEW